MGEITGPVLHLVLAVAGAVLIWLAGRLVAAAAVSLTSAIAALLERLLADEEIPYPAPLSVPPRRHARGGAVHGRAPPLAA
jgi:predicted metal-binding membrane protein